MKLNIFKIFPPTAAYPTPEALQAQADAAGPEAQNNLGILYASGGTVPQDYSTAAQCFLQAAEKGYALAQLNLARLYASGKGPLRDEAAANKWLRRAANQGDAGAQFDLGIALHRQSLDGTAITAHDTKIEGLMWLQLAAAQGFYRAASACERLNLQMTHSEIDEAKQRADAFVPVRE